MYVVVQLLSRVWLCDPVDCSTPGFPVLTISWVCPSSYQLSWWCHPTISSSVIPFASCLLSFPASGSFLSQLFALGGQSIGASASASTSVLLMYIQDWFPLGFDGFVLLVVQGTLKSLLQNHSSKHQFFSAQLSFCSNSYINTWLPEKLQLWLYGPLLAK